MSLPYYENSSVFEVVYMRFYLVLLAAFLAVCSDSYAGDGRMRGFTIPSSAVPSDIAALEGYNVNHIRIHLINQNNNTDTLEQYLTWLASEIVYVDDVVLPAIEALDPDIKVVISLTSLPGGFYVETPLPQMALFQFATYQTAIINAWADIATQFHDNSNVMGYIMVSEPAVGKTPGDGAMKWPQLAAAIAAKIRTVDTEKTIFMTPDYSSPLKLAKMARLQEYAPVDYTINMYDPYKYTHQGLYGNKSGLAWGGRKKFKKRQLRLSLAKARTFARASNEHLYIGEFSVVRWAVGSDAYLTDLINLFEAYKWDWAFHSWREASVWSVEHSDDPDVSERVGTSDRAEVLKTYFSRN